MAIQGNAIFWLQKRVMRVTFRTDASLEIGTGHVMRCLTLAEALSAQNVTCEFICREHEGNLIEFIRKKGFFTHKLPIILNSNISLNSHTIETIHETAHSRFLGANQTQDAEACTAILLEQRPDWVIVDHYGLDAFWERVLAPHYGNLMVIDDLADRSHDCNILLDQTFGRDPADYHSLVPAGCNLLCGSKYALLRPEFAALRPYSLKRRARSAFRELLITMGGIDKDNGTGQALQALRKCKLPTDCRITVVMGANSPWLNAVHKEAQQMTRPVRVLVGVREMAKLMAESDLAIGAAGATSWERCCMALPTIMLVLAENQIKVASELEKFGAAIVLNGIRNLELQIMDIFNKFNEDERFLLNMSKCAANVADGLGVNIVVGHMGIRSE